MNNQDKPKFNPNKPFTVVDKPKFDPNKPFKEVSDTDLSNTVKTEKNNVTESEFQSFMQTNPNVVAWKNEFKKQYGEEPNINNSDYDYRGAFEAGIVPEKNEQDGTYHWGSIGLNGKDLKSETHPTRWKSEYMKLSGKNPDEIGIDFLSAKKSYPELEKYKPTNGQSKEDIDAQLRKSSIIPPEEAEKRRIGEVSLPESKLPQELSNQKPYEQPMQEKPDYMGVFNNKEDIKTVNERGVSVSLFDEVKKSAAQAEYPVEYMAEANFIKNRIEKLKKHYPQAGNDIAAIPINKINPQNIEEITKAVDNIESKYDKSFMSGVFSPVEVKSKYKTEVEGDKDYLIAIRMLNEDNNDLKYAATGKDVSIVGEALKAQQQAGAGLLGGAYELGRAVVTGDSKSVLRGTGKGLENYAEGYTDFVNDLKGNSAVNTVLNKLENDEESLTTNDKLLLKSIFDNAKLHEKLDKEIPSSYKIGGSLGTSAGFMGEFVLTGGVAGGVGKAVLKQGAKMGIKSTVGKLGLNAAIKLAKTGIQTPLMPSLWQKTAMDVSKGDSFGDAFVNNLWQTGAEVGSEMILMVNPVKGAGGAANDILRRAGINFNVDKGAVGVLRNTLEEYAEEKVGEIMTAPKDYNSFKEFWKGFTDKEQNLITFGSVALMTGGMGSVAIAGNSISKARYESGLAKYEKWLPSDIRAEIDVLVNNKDLTVQEQYNLTGEIISKRIDEGKLGESPNETAANAIEYLTYKTKLAAAESTDNSATIENGEITVGKVEEGDLTSQQEQIDYLKKQGVEIPDGTKMEGLTKLYNETKKSETPKVSERDTKLEFVKSRGIEITEDISDNELDKTYRGQRVSKIKEDNVDFDNQIAESQKRLGLPTTPDIQISDDTELTLEQIDNEEQVPNVFIKGASQELYDRYKELEAMKQSETRTYTTEQIESMQEYLQEEITNLENYANEQAETGEFISKTKVGETPETGTGEDITEETVNIFEKTDTKLAESANNVKIVPEKVPEIKSDLPETKPTKDLVEAKSPQKVEPGVEGGEQKLSTSEEKKADIESRRQDELRDRKLSKEKIDKQIEQEKKDLERYEETPDKPDFFILIDKAKNRLENLLNDKELLDKINAKYDAELSVLDKPETPLKAKVEVTGDNKQKQTELKEFKQFESAVTESKSVEEAFEKVGKIKDVSPELSESFRKKYDPENNLTPKQAFEKYYNEVKKVEKDFMQQISDINNQINEIHKSNPKEFKKDGTIRANSKLLPTYNALIKAKDELAVKATEQLPELSKKEKEKSKTETEKLNKAFEERNKEYQKKTNMTDDEIMDVTISDKMRFGEELTDTELKWANDNYFRPKGYEFDKNGSLIKESGEKVEAAAQPELTKEDLYDQRVSYIPEGQTEPLVGDVMRFEKGKVLVKMDNGKSFYAKPNELTIIEKPPKVAEQPEVKEIPKPQRKQTPIEQAAAKYGWEIDYDEITGDILLVNRKSSAVAIVKQKGSNYTIYDLHKKKLLSGNKDVAQAVDKVIKDYFYGKEVEKKVEQPEVTPSKEAKVVEPTSIKPVLSEAEFVKSGIDKYIADNNITREKFDNSAKSVDIENGIIDSYSKYIKSLQKSGELQSLFDNGNISDKIKIRKAIQTAGFEVENIIDTTKEKTDAKSKRKDEKRKHREEIAEVLELNKPNKASREQRIADINEELGDVWSDLADIVGAKKSLTGEQRKKLIPVIQKVAKLYTEKWLLKGQELIDHIKEHFSAQGISLDDKLVKKSISEYSKTRGVPSGRMEMKTAKSKIIESVKQALKGNEIDQLTRAEATQLLNKIKKASINNLEKVQKEADDFIKTISEKNETNKLINNINGLIKTKTVERDYRGIKKATNVSSEVKYYLDKTKVIWDKAVSLNKQKKLVKSDFVTDKKGEGKKQQELEFSLAQEELENRGRDEFKEFIDKQIAEVELNQLSDNPIAREKAVYEEIAIRDLQDAYEQNLESLSAISENINRTIKEGRKALKDEIRADVERRNEIKVNSRKATENKYSGKSRRDIQNEIYERNKNAVRQFFIEKKDAAKETFTKPITTSFEFLLKYIEAGTSRMGEGKLYDYFMKGENGWLTARENRLRRKEAIYDEIKDKVKEATKSKWTGYNIAKWSTVTNKTGIFRINESGERNSYEEAMSKGQAMYLYAVSRMEGMGERLLFQGWDTAALKQVKDYMGNDLVSFTEWVSDDLFKRLHKDYNKTYLEIYKTPLDHIEHYFPLLYDSFGTLTKSSELIIGENKFIIPTTTPKNIKSRVRNVNEISTTADFSEVMYNYIDAMEKFHNYSRFVKDVNVLFTDKTTRSQIQNNDTQALKQLINATNVAIENDSNEYLGAEQAIHVLNRATAFAKISLRTWTALKQYLSTPAFFENAKEAHIKIGSKSIYVPFVGTATFAAKVIANIINPVATYKNYKFLKKESASLNNRIKQGNFGDEEIARGFVSLHQMGTTPFRFVTGKIMEKIGRSGIFFNKMVDLHTIISGGKVLYDQQFKEYKKIMSEKEAHRLAIRDFDLAYNLAQQSSEPAFLSEAQSKKGILKSFFATFKNSQFSYYRKVVEGQINLFNGYSRTVDKYTKEYKALGINDKTSRMKARAKGLSYLTTHDAKNDFKKIGIYGYVLPVMWQYALSGLPGLLTAWNDDDTDEMKRALYLGPIDGMFILGDITESAYDAIFMNKRFMEWQPSQLITTINDGIKDIAKSLKENGSVNIDVMVEFLRQAIITKGIDIDNIGLIYEGMANMIIDGDYTEENVLKILAAPKGITKEVEKKKKSKNTKKANISY